MGVTAESAGKIPFCDVTTLLDPYFMARLASGSNLSSVLVPLFFIGYNRPALIRWHYVLSTKLAEEVPPDLSLYTQQECEFTYGSRRTTVL